jgi:hypothetical protein
MYSVKTGIFLCIGAMLISGCGHVTRLSPDFGVAIRQDLAAQIADPEPRYVGTPTPGSNGPRTSLSQRRYQANEVLPPATLGSTAEVPGAGATMGGEASSGVALPGGQ